MLKRPLLIVLSLVTLTFAASCKIQLDSAASDIAIEYARNKVATITLLECKFGFEDTKSFKAERVSGYDVRQVDKENGIEERHYVVVRYIYQCKGETEWKEDSMFFPVIKTKNAGWEVERHRIESN